MTNKDSLTVMQVKAIQLLMTGRNDQAVADDGQVEREQQASDDLLKMFEVASA